MVKFLRLLLLPFSVLYGIAVIGRNKLYDLGILRSSAFDLPVICVGNLVVGGSGKSPVTEYLVALLDGYKIAILSRGYGRETTGFLYADELATAQSIGDEPMQFYRKFPQVTVAVCEDRAAGINRLKETHDLIILDDAFQHRRVKPGLSILLFEFEKLLHRQFLLPAGNLREPFRGYKRADILLVTKSPENLRAELQEECAAHFDTRSAEHLFFSSIRYGDLNGVFTGETLPIEEIKNKQVFLLTGIANPEPLARYLKQYSPAVEHFDFPDHYQFSKRDMARLVHAFRQSAAEEKIVITTEKDSQRLFDVVIKELLLNLPVFYLPIKIAVLTDEQIKFNQKILNYVSNVTHNGRIYKTKN
jgi:tetraacyldisaccharide 4'-kinase